MTRFQIERFLRTRAWWPLALALLVGGVGLGGYWLGQHQTVGAVQARAGAPGAAATPQSLDPKAVKVSPHPGGTVTAITTDPTGFTFRLESGEEITARVIDGTIFQAGRDRPYSFGLLKVGDFVRVQGPGLGPKAVDPASPNAPARKPDGAARKPEGANLAFATDGTPIARRVVVRPAGEQPRGLGGKNLGACLAGADPAGQPGCPPPARPTKKGAANGAQQ